MIEIIKSVSEMRSRAAEWSFAPKVALVPTMGALHDGHLALVHAAREQAESVLISIFVNPLQFGPGEDFEKYPRDYERDFGLLEQAGADVVFTPDYDDMTPPGMIFKVDPGPLAQRLCGKYRPGHFAGVTTIVTKLFQITRPGRAIFGWKDAQQFLILRRMVQDLNMPVSLNALDTIREDSGLAMSSRNRYLNEAQRRAAPSIYGALKEARRMFESGVTDTIELLAAVREAIGSQEELKLQYAEAVAMDTLEPVDTVIAGNTLIAVAVFAGDTRLIDNIRL